MFAGRVTSLFSFFTLILVQSGIKSGNVIEGCSKYSLSPDGITSLCLECYRGFQASENKLTCVQCPLGCIRCTPMGECLQCKEGAYVDKGNCISCTTNCLECEKGICTKCLDDHSLMPELVCIKCPKYCSACSSKDICTTCYRGFKPSGQFAGMFCEIDESYTKLESWIIAVVVISVLLIFLCCCCFFIGVYSEAEHTTRVQGKTYEDYQEDLLESRIDSDGKPIRSSKKRSRTPTFQKIREQPLTNIQSSGISSTQSRNQSQIKPMEIGGKPLTLQKTFS